MDKSKSTEKIDGSIATVMALDRAIRNKNGTSDSGYDLRGLLIIEKSISIKTITLVIIKMK